MVEKTKYEKCKENKMNKIMKEFESDKLKNRSNKKIKSRKQAVAIGLSISESKCNKLFSENDYKKIEERFYKDIYDKNGNIKNDKCLSYTTVKSGIKLYDYYKSKKNYKKATSIKDDLILRYMLNMKNCKNKLIKKDMINFVKK